MKIALYRGNTFIGKCILFFCRGGYTHVALVLDDGRVIESYPGTGVRLRRSVTDGMKNYKIDIFEVPTTEEQNEIIKDFLANQIGKKYDYSAFLGFVFYTTTQDRRESNRWMCSELVFSALQKVDINLLERVKAWMVSPTIVSFSPIMKYHSTIEV